MAKKPHPSLQGKKPENKSPATRNKPVTNNPSHIRNRMKRSEMYGKYLIQKKVEKKDRRLKREKEAAALGEDVEHAKQTPRTLDNTREREETTVTPEDAEVMADEMDDEFAQYFSDEKRPRILLTTRPRPSQQLFSFIQELINLLPQCFYYPRKSYSIKDICFFATNREFTHVIVLSEKSKVCNSMLVSHLPHGPTAYFKVSNVISSHDVPFRGHATSHVPELNLHGFGTRLGHRVGRFLGGMFPHNAELQGRQIVTFHNQRDFIFVRHHRYVFEEGKEITKETKKKKTTARLQELGPRFTLKMRWLQDGTFDSQFGEYEWFHKRKEMDTTRRKFHL
jgi:ribosome production factor 1